MRFIIAHLRTPRLTSLSLTTPSDECIPSFLAFARSSDLGACLRALTVNLPPSEGYEDFVEFLGELDSLATLIIVGDAQGRVRGLESGRSSFDRRVDALLRALRWPSAHDVQEASTSDPIHIHDNWSRVPFRICPTLSSLEFDDSTMSLQLLKDMVRSRRHLTHGPPGSLLRSATLKDVVFTEDDSESSWKWLRDMEKEGVITRSSLSGNVLTIFEG